MEIENVLNLRKLLKERDTEIERLNRRIQSKDRHILYLENQLNQAQFKVHQYSSQLSEMERRRRVLDKKTITIAGG